MLCNPILRSDDMEMSRGRDWCHAALKTRFWWAFIDCEGWLALNLMSKICIIGSAEPDVRCKPSGDHAWFIKDDWDALLSCFQPNPWISSPFCLMSYSSSCLSGVLQEISKKWRTVSRKYQKKYWYYIYIWSLFRQRMKRIQ